MNHHALLQDRNGEWKKIHAFDYGGTKMPMSSHCRFAYRARPWLIAASVIGLAVFVVGQFLLIEAKTQHYHFRFSHSRFAVIRYNQTVATVGYAIHPGWEIHLYTDAPFYIEFIPHLRDVFWSTGAIIGQAILVPITIPLLLLLLATVWGMIAGKMNEGGPRCAKCDYSLTGNTSGVCPECATSVTRSVSDRVPPAL